MLEGKHIAVLIEDDFDDFEVTELLRIMTSNDVRVTIVGPDSQRTYKGMRGSAKLNADLSADKVNVEDIDVFVVPGGGTLNKLRMHQPVIDLIRKADEAGKTIAAFGYGPQLLISAEIVRGRRLTSWPSIAVDVRNAGAEWVDAPVVRDRNLVTSRRLGDLTRFHKAIIKALSD